MHIGRVAAARGPTEQIYRDSGLTGLDRKNSETIEAAEMVRIGIQCLPIQSLRRTELSRLMMPARRREQIIRVSPLGATPPTHPFTHRREPESREIADL
jgi:hypothetical protein